VEISSAAPHRPSSMSSGFLSACVVMLIPQFIPGGQRQRRLLFPTRVEKATNFCLAAMQYGYIPRWHADVALLEE